MRYIRCARHQREQNLFAFQYMGKIYYRAFREIAPGGEMLVWYDEKYPQYLGIPSNVFDMAAFIPSGRLKWDVVLRASEFVVFVYISVLLTNLVFFLSRNCLCFALLHVEFDVPCLYLYLFCVCLCECLFMFVCLYAYVHVYMHSSRSRSRGLLIWLVSLSFRSSLVCLFVCLRCLTVTLLFTSNPVYFNRNRCCTRQRNCSGVPRKRLHPSDAYLAAFLPAITFGI